MSAVSTINVVVLCKEPRIEGVSAPHFAANDFLHCTLNQPHINVSVTAMSQKQVSAKKQQGTSGFPVLSKPILWLT